MKLKDTKISSKLRNIKLSKKFRDIKMDLKETDFSLKKAGKIDMKLNARKNTKW